MNPRLKKLLMILILPFYMGIYGMLILILSDFIPRNVFIELVFYIIAGVIWVFPLRPLFIWANGPAKK